MDTQTNAKLQLAYNFIQYTNQNIFLTGKAGTGKTTFMKNLREKSPKRMVVVAPTGVAAINAGGVTIHSFFQLSFGPQLPYDQANTFSGNTNAPAALKRFNKEKINIIRSIDLLVIDEISMVRSDVLDGIDGVLRRFRDRNKPFGGLQLLMIGDLQQLAPIVKEDEWQILRNYYETCYFFSSRALQQSTFVGIELDHIFRQSDREFIELLNRVRNNQLDNDLLKKLNSRYIPGFNPSDDEGYIILTTHNYQSKQINEAKLDALKTKPVVFKARIEDDFPEYAYPTDLNLTLKTGSQVMFIKNDPSADKRFYNGKIGKVIKFHSESVEVLCPGETTIIEVFPAVWENARYKLNEETQEIEEEVIGKFTQLPLKLAWAITIHKSQGLTFEKAIIDARQSFAHGQVYVALSRCRSLEGVVLRTQLSSGSVINDQTVQGFSSRVEQNQPGEKELHQSRKQYELQLLNELYDFRPFIRFIHYVLKIWDEHSASLMGRLGLEFQQAAIQLEKEVITVGDNFRRQVEKLMQYPLPSEKNIQLHERLKKASAWFLEKLDAWIDKPLERTGFQTDNRAVRKAVTDALNRFESEWDIRKSCLLFVQQNGFELKPYLETRAKAAIEKPAWKKAGQSLAVDSAHPEFFSRLTTWRDQKADELGWFQPDVLSQKVMIAISDVIPASAAGLKAVKGMGGKKMNYFGKEILELILLYRKEKGMELPDNAQTEVAFAGLDSQSISMAMFRQGMKPEKIALKRELSQGTIEGHLARFIAKGQLDVFELVDRKKYQVVKEVVKANPVITTAEIKNALDPLVTYGEIRMIMADLGR